MSDDGRSRVLAAATSLFARRGYAAVSIRDIAAEAGLSKPGIYHHFASKEELLLAILEGELAASAPILGRLSDRGLPWEGRLIAWIAETLELPPERSSIVIRLGQETAQLAAEQRRAFALRYRAAYLEPILAFLREGEEGGRLREGSAEFDLWFILGALTPFLQDPAKPRPGIAPPGQLAPLLARAILGGIGR